MSLSDANITKYRVVRGGSVCQPGMGAETPGKGQPPPTEDGPTDPGCTHRRAGRENESARARSQERETERTNVTRAEWEAREEKK